MAKNDTECGKSTRREWITYGGAVLAGGLLAGCTGESEGNTSPTADTETETAEESGSYTVSMEPVGELTFESVPDRWVAYDGGYADMGVALGKTDGMTGIGGSDRYYTDVYDELPGVSVERETLEANDLGDADMSKEVFYELDNDVHLMDPQMLVNWFGWSETDVDEIATNVGPFFGNLIFRREDKWHDYRYYTLYEAFEKVAQLFQEEERFNAFQSLHDEFIAEIQRQLPPADERPNVLLVYEGSDEPETFSPYRLNDRGTSKKQWRDLGVSDALSGTGIHGISTTDRGRIDYETMLEIDPDVIMLRAHERKSATEFRETVLEFMRDHPVGSELTAVQNGRVYRGGYLYQGPIHNLFLTERGAKQLYPDVFGDVTSDEKLFDRQRVADIVTGEF
ncbi:ferrichrome ABC transporter substrate-binding protein [Halogeometricum borinquense DSM 11551]|uniref:Ferrichrome ABC transporter substrate-binding protein n=2 Tax=Halogeometricum borinquense TaxID=60847 RepID=E4NKP4_HALBP|nr:ABC transporter substrate-binding protein [Halogeometricum borinquense]ADQ65940.1 ferrichrome-binding protein [Halogeometricum borinquense DSM 11551]ELY23096.1 ferrichrome ABC transporter substrate-binding protein [Halogeometricum borinquense DSM 11551]RYJ14166.1 Fe3+-hydroxamate ABC transporter substrate-binding protein [Halogeometricum borinquense]